MRNKSWLRLFLPWLFLVLVVLGFPAFAQTRYILKTATPPDATRIAAQYSLTILHTLEETQSSYVVLVPANLDAHQIAEIRSDHSVVEFVPDTAVDATEKVTPSVHARALDPLSDALAIQGTQIYYGAQVRAGYVQQTAASLIHLAQTQQLFPAGNDIVAVIDTGVDPHHPALAGVLVPGFDFINDVAGIPSDLTGLSQSTVAILDQSTVAILDSKNSPVVLNQSTVAILDQSTVAILDADQLPKAFGHGTMVSGLIHLVAPGARIMPLRAFQSDGTANLSDVIRAIYYAVDHNAKVINMSFSMTGNSPDLQQAVTYAASHGVVMVASAGNEGKEMMVYPAGFRGVYGVGSVDKSDLRSPFSNFGDVARLAAPGEALVTTYPGNNYAAVWGTSFSTALVSGAAAIITSYKPSLHPGSLSNVFDQGPRIGQDVGDSRLDLLPSMIFCEHQNYNGGDN